VSSNIIYYKPAAANAIRNSFFKLLIGAIITKQQTKELTQEKMASKVLE
jgi:hypothetical protein